MENNTCPLCGEWCNVQSLPDYINDKSVACENCGTFIMSNDVLMNGDNDADYVESKNNGWELILNPQIAIKRCNLIYEFLLKKPYYTNCSIPLGNRRNFRFFYNKNSVGQTSPEPWFINVADLMKSYPKNIAEKLDRILLNLSLRCPNIGDEIIYGNLSNRLFFIEKSISDVTNEKETLISFLREANLIVVVQAHYRLTSKAWERIDELTRKQREVNQGFIAMRFPSNRDDEATKQDLTSISDSFKKAINACGYAPRIMLDVEHNNQIVPEIFFEIEQSKFTIVDVTYPNYGAYYEAGYAQALGKQVIICCRKGSEKTHFDISQKNTIFWTDESDLITRLIKRIQATIGVNK